MLLFIIMERDNMIIGDRVDKIEAEINERKPHEGLKLNIAVRDVEKKEKQLSIRYAYEVVYEGVGKIHVQGTVIAEEDDKTTKDILDSWEKNKMLPKDYMERLLNAINYTCASHATIIARVLNYPPPLIPPRLSLKENNEKPKK